MTKAVYQAVRGSKPVPQGTASQKEDAKAARKAALIEKRKMFSSISYTCIAILVGILGAQFLTRFKLAADDAGNPRLSKFYESAIYFWGATLYLIIRNVIWTSKWVKLLNRADTGKAAKPGAPPAAAGGAKIPPAVPAPTEDTRHLAVKKDA